MATMIFNDQQNSPDYAEAKARLKEANAEVDARWKRL